MTNFQEKWSTLNPHERPVHLSQVSQLALDRLQTKETGKLTGWLADVVATTPADGEKRKDTWLTARYRLIEESSRLWIDSIFSELKGFVREFNDSDKAQFIHVVAVSPRVNMQLPCKRDPSSEPYIFSCYEGHLATSEWALLIRTYYEAIQIYILHAEMLLGLEFDKLSVYEIKPFAELRPAVNQDRVEWSLAGVTITDQSIPSMAREIFADFIQVALGLLDEDNLFSPVLPNAGDRNDVMSTPEEDQVNEFLRDLQLWQAHEVISRAISQDLQSLIKYSLQPDLGLAIQTRVKSLEADCTRLEVAWKQFLETLEPVSASTQIPVPV